MTPEGAFERIKKHVEAQRVPGASIILPLSGGSNASTQTFTRTLGLPTIVTNYAQPNNGQHGPNEHLRIDHFLTGIKMGAAALSALGR